MNVNKTEIVAILRSRGRDARADWVDRTLSDVVDTARNASLLVTLEIDAATLIPVGAVPQPAGISA